MSRSKLRVWYLSAQGEVRPVNSGGGWRVREYESGSGCYVQHKSAGEMRWDTIATVRDLDSAIEFVSSWHKDEMRDVKARR